MALQDEVQCSYPVRLVDHAPAPPPFWNPHSIAVHYHIRKARGRISNFEWVRSLYSQAGSEWIPVNTCCQQIWTSRCQEISIHVWRVNMQSYVMLYNNWWIINECCECYTVPLVATSIGSELRVEISVWVGGWDSKLGAAIAVDAACCFFLRSAAASFFPFCSALYAVLVQQQERQLEYTAIQTFIMPKNKVYQK